MIFHQHPHSRVTDEKVRSQQDVLRARLMSQLSHWQNIKTLPRKINGFLLLFLLSSSICLYVCLYLISVNFVWRSQMLSYPLMIGFNCLLEANWCWPAQAIHVAKRTSCTVFKLYVFATLSSAKTNYCCFYNNIKISFQIFWSCTSLSAFWIPSIF